MSVRYSARALAKLDAIYDYLNARNASAASDVLRSIRESVHHLEDLPQLGRPTDEGDVRVLIEPQYGYRVFYRVRGRDVLVIRMLHPAEDWADRAKG